jgi:hypothetical protein
VGIRQNAFDEVGLYSIQTAGMVLEGQHAGLPELLVNPVDNRSGFVILKEMKIF